MWSRPGSLANSVPWLSLGDSSASIRIDLAPSLERRPQQFRAARVVKGRQVVNSKPFGVAGRFAPHEDLESRIFPDIRDKPTHAREDHLPLKTMKFAS